MKVREQLIKVWEEMAHGPEQVERGNAVANPLSRAISADRPAGRF